MNASLSSPGWDRGLESHKPEEDFCPGEPALTNLRTVFVSWNGRLALTLTNVPFQGPPRLEKHSGTYIQKPVQLRVCVTLPQGVAE